MLLLFFLYKFRCQMLSSVGSVFSGMSRSERINSRILSSFSSCRSVRCTRVLVESFAWAFWYFCHRLKSVFLLLHHLRAGLKPITKQIIQTLPKACVSKRSKQAKANVRLGVVVWKGCEANLEEFLFRLLYDVEFASAEDVKADG